jgi:mannose-6-phosphate isomerase-like protein (cupin superfamily)
MNNHIKAIEVYDVIKISGRWDEPSRESVVGTFTREYKTRRKIEELEKNIPEEESWDNVIYTIRPRLVRPETVKDYIERPQNFVHLEEVSPMEDTCGEIREIYKSDRLSLAHVRLSGKATRHLHHVMEEVYYITRGDGYLTIGEERYPIEEGDTIGIPKDVWHYLETEEGKEMELIAVTHPMFNSDDVIIDG